MTTFINDANQEITISEDILITRQVASFKNFNIKGDFSVSFKVPNSSDNRNTLGYYGPNQVDSPIFSSQSFNMVRNGNIIIRGNIVIEQDLGDELSLYFIGGNVNWFDKLKFSCKDIRTTRHQTIWSRSATETRASATEGIVFPIVDWAFKGQKSDNYLSEAYSGDSSDITVNSGNLFFVYDIFPCLFVHTLLDEIANHSGIKITGTIFNDKFFNSLILTPENPDIVDPETGEEIIPLQTVTVQSIAPTIDAIDLVKWVCVTFGAIPTFDAFSNTLSIDLSNKFPLGDSDNWSEYVKSYTIEYDQIQNTEINPDDPKDDLLKSYNDSHDIQFGALNIESAKLDGQTEEIYKSIFPVCYDSINSVSGLAVPYIPMYELEDDQAYVINEIDLQTSTGDSSYLKIKGVGFPFSQDMIYFPLIIRIKDSANLYSGYRRMWRDIFDTSFEFSNTQCGAYGAYVGPATGTLYTQRVSKGKPGARVLSFVQSISASDFSGSTFRDGSPYDYTSISTASTAYFHKPFYSQYPNLMKHRQGLSYGPVDGYSDFPISDIYYNRIKGMIVGPTIKTKMLIPESVFHSFNFRFIYLNTGRLNGYYFVDSIVNYKDAATEVEVNLLSLSNNDVIYTAPVINEYSLELDAGAYTYTGYDVTFETVTCITWEATNESGGTANVYYINCAGNSDSDSIPNGQTITICALVGTTPTGDVAVTVTEIGNPC